MDQPQRSFDERMGVLIGAMDEVATQQARGEDASQAALAAALELRDIREEAAEIGMDLRPVVTVVVGEGAAPDPDAPGQAGDLICAEAAWSLTTPNPTLIVRCAWIIRT